MFFSRSARRIVGLARLSLGFCFASATVAPVGAEPATVLFHDQTLTIERTLPDPKELWVTPDDLTKINGFKLKPEGACLNDLCIPIPPGKEAEFLAKRDGQTWFNVAQLARTLKEACVADADKRVWSFGPIPQTVAATLDSAVAPDFALPDVNGKVHRLADYKGKKVLILTWASWCGCSLDLPGWQKVYDELKGKNFEIIAAAQDSGGAAAAAKYYTRANATFAPLIDQYHTISTLYQMVNVPTGVWVNEEGKIVRPGEVAYSGRIKLGPMEVPGDQYVAALRDWVEKGDKSIYAMKPEELKKRVSPRDADLQLADANFKLGVYFHLQGDPSRAEKYWKQAQTLNPDSWNYHRQDWSFTSDAMKNWTAKFKALNGKPYYAPLDLPKAAP